MPDSEKQWELELWVNENGFCPVADFFDELNIRKGVEYERMTKQLIRFQTQPFTRLKQTQDIGKVKNEEFWEMRFNVRIEIRLLGIIKENHGHEVFVAVHGFHKKDQKLRQSDIEKARNRIKQII